MGHVPPRTLREERPRADLSRRQHRGTRAGTDHLTAPPGSSTRRRAVGALGERIAAAFLQRRGLRIIDRNLEVGRGEIDILAESHGERIVVEVKTVTPAAGRSGASAVDEAKAGRLCALAATLDPPVGRIDIVEILLDKDGASVRWLRRT